MPSSRFDVANPVLDQLAPERRLERDAPLVAAYLGGRPVVLARPEERSEAYPEDLTIPISLSRLRRAIDIERDRATGPFVPSLVEDVPLSGSESLSDCQFAAAVTLGLGALCAGLAALMAKPKERTRQAALGALTGVGTGALLIAVVAAGFPSA
jgi:hypothetical protein